jgi:hypothetical protein
VIFAGEHVPAITAPSTNDDSLEPIYLEDWTSRQSKDVAFRTYYGLRTSKATDSVSHVLSPNYNFPEVNFADIEVVVRQLCEESPECSKAGYVSRVPRDCS